MSGLPDSNPSNEQMSDPYAKGGERHWFWWAAKTYVRPGLFFRHRRIVRWPWR